MEIIAHRGLWKSENERNTMEAFRKCVSLGIGTETDFRDYCRKLVISHNAADENCPDAVDFFELYAGSKSTLALNVKADGMQELLKPLLIKYQINNYFCFDMSIPDLLGYIEYGINFFVRESEYEGINSLYHAADGVWMDGFIGDEWITVERVLYHRRNNKRVCIVSSDLHKREHKELWNRIKDEKITSDNNIILCTDYPLEAKEFFYGK